MKEILYALFGVVMLISGFGLGMMAHESGFIKPDVNHMKMK